MKMMIQVTLPLIRPPQKVHEGYAPRRSLSEASCALACSLPFLHATPTPLHHPPAPWLSQTEESQWALCRSPPSSSSTTSLLTPRAAPSAFARSVRHQVRSRPCAGLTRAFAPRRFDTVNPATEEVITSVQAAGKEDVDDAVAAATTAFAAFRKSNGCDRRDMLLRLASLLEKHRVQLAELESLDNGKPQHVADAVDIGCACLAPPCACTCARARAGGAMAPVPDACPH